MLLTIDIGNTNTVLAVFDGQGADAKCVCISRIDTSVKRMADQYAVIIRDIMRLKLPQGGITAAIISSVVPPVTVQIADAVKTLWSIDALIVDTAMGIRCGLEIKIDEPHLLGADLLCGAFAAKELYFRNGTPVIAVDLGTVTKIMAMNKDGALVGGAIAPGVGSGFAAMAGTTALLPLVGTAGSLGAAIGTNTADCIRSGVLYGTAALIDGMSARFEEELGGEAIAVATGGFAHAVVPHCTHSFAVDKLLVSQGLRLLYEHDVAG